MCTCTYTHVYLYTQVQICIHMYVNSHTHTLKESSRTFIATIGVFKKIPYKGRVNPLIYLTKCSIRGAEPLREDIWDTIVAHTLSSQGTRNQSSQGALTVYQ